MSNKVAVRLDRGKQVIVIGLMKCAKVLHCATSGMGK